MQKIPTKLLFLFYFATAVYGSPSLDQGRTFQGPQLNLMWVADAGHFITSGISEHPVVPASKAYQLISEMNSGRIENYGFRNWRLAMEIDTTTLDVSPFVVDSNVAVAGFVNPFGMAPKDFSAQTILTPQSQ